MSDSLIVSSLAFEASNREFCRRPQHEMPVQWGKLRLKRVAQTEGVRQLIADARKESISLDHEYIGTEHLVLALCHQGADTGLLRALDVDQERVDATINRIIQRGQRTLEPSLERPFTSRTKHVFALAAETAHDLGHADIDLPHILVGLLRERLNIGAQVLADQGLTAERAYEYARRSGPTG